MKKNISGQKIGVQMVSASDGSAFTGSVTVSVTGDAGTQATGSVGSGACTHEGNGYHTYAPAQAETNYDLIAFTFTGTGAIPATVQVFTVNGLLTASAITNMETVFVGDFATAYNTTTDGWNVNTTHAAGTAWNSGAIGASTLASDTIAAAKIATGAITAAKFAAGAIDAAAIATDAIDADAIKADAVTEIQNGLATATNLATVAGYLDTEIASILSTVTANASSLSSLTTAVNTIDDFLDTEIAAILAAVDTEIATIITHLTDIKGATWTTTDTLEAIRDRGDAAWITATGFSTLDAAGVRTAVGLASANLDTQLGDLPTNAELATAITTGLTTALTEGYRGTGATGSVRDLLYEVIAHLGEFSITSTTKTLKKLDASTTAKTYTLNDASTPTAITETT